ARIIRIDRASSCGQSQPAPGRRAKLRRPWWFCSFMDPPVRTSLSAAAAGRSLPGAGRVKVCAGYGAGSQALRLAPTCPAAPCQRDPGQAVTLAMIICLGSTSYGGTGMLEMLGLDHTCESVYRAMLANDSWGVAQLADHLVLPESDVRGALDQLAELAL